MAVKCAICNGTSFIKSGNNNYVCTNCKMIYSKEAIEKMKAADKSEINNQTKSVNNQPNSVNNQPSQTSGRLDSTFSFSDTDTAKDKLTPKEVIATLVVMFICIFLLSRCFFVRTSDSAASSSYVTAKAAAETQEDQITKAVTTTVWETEPIKTTPASVYDNVERVTVEMLYNELERNAMRAEDYTDQYLIITGYLGNMDSDGKYFSLNKTSSSILDSIHMSINDSSIVDELKMHDRGDAISVYCKITDVGEIIGYNADAYRIV